MIEMTGKIGWTGKIGRTGKIGWHLRVLGDVCRDGGGFRGGGDVQERSDVIRKLGEGGVACRHLRYTPQLGFRVEG